MPDTSAHTLLTRPACSSARPASCSVALPARPARPPGRLPGRPVSCSVALPVRFAARLALPALPACPVALPALLACPVACPVALLVRFAARARLAHAIPDVPRPFRRALPVLPISR